MALNKFGIAARFLEIAYQPQLLLRSSEKPIGVKTRSSKEPKKAFLPQIWQKNGFLKGVPKKYSKMKVRFVFSMKK